MKRRLALARALLAPSDAVALDEPFTGLDGDNRQRAIEAIRRAAETKPVVLVTHDRDDLAALDARVIPAVSGGAFRSINGMRKTHTVFLWKARKNMPGVELFAGNSVYRSRERRERPPKGG